MECDSLGEEIYARTFNINRRNDYIRNTNNVKLQLRFNVAEATNQNPNHEHDNKPNKVEPATTEISMIQK